MKKVIWALFDDATGSWNHCNYDREKYIIYSFGININGWENYHRIDLRLSNPNLIKELSKFPKPDIIVAHPPCESWSIADNQQRLFRKVEGRTIELYNWEDNQYNNSIVYKKLRRDYFKQWGTTMVGFETAITTNFIIHHFNPKVWIIENPQSSKIWEFLRSFGNLSGYYNLTYYNCYDCCFTKKPTYFFSNTSIPLKKEHIKSCKKWSEVAGYDIRSAVPEPLLIDILTLLEEKWNII